jgi:hypothetical protein
MVFYVNSGRTKQAKRAMVAEIRAAVEIVAQWTLTSPNTNDSFLHHVDVELLSRYGLVKGQEILNEFAEALGGQSVSQKGIR